MSRSWGITFPLLLMGLHLIVSSFHFFVVEGFAGLQQPERHAQLWKTTNQCQRRCHNSEILQQNLRMDRITRLFAIKDDNLDVDSDDDDDERMYARVRRSRRGQQQEREYNYDDETNKKPFDEEDYDTYRRNQKYEDDYEWVDDLLDDEDYDDDEDDDDEPVYGLFGNEIIPNELLDNIDPDGAAERFPELASDPRFWFDMFLFVAFLDFLSWVGPRDPFPDLPPL